MLAWNECPICASEFTLYLQEIMLQRQHRRTAQYHCMNCESFFHRSDYHEDSGQHEGDAAWLLDHPDSSNGLLISYLRDQGDTHTVYEAGCGVGDLLLGLSAAGFQSRGVDPNPVAVAIASERGARAELGYFVELADPVDAIIAVDVLEHLDAPRPFFAALRDSVRRAGLIVIRVPEVERQHWQWLKGANQIRGFDAADPFRDNSVHITHFSKRGLQIMGESLGTTYVCGLPGGFHVFRTS